MVESRPTQRNMRELCFNAFNGSPWTGQGVSLADQIAAAADAGFPLIGIDRYTMEHYLEQRAGIRDAQTLLDQAGIRCGVITAAGMLGADPQAIECIARASDWARELNAPFVQINVGNAGGEQRDVLEQACDAAGRGVRLAIEYMPFTPLNRVDDAVALVQGVGLERAGLLIDVWHHERGPDSYEDLAGAPLDAICYVEFDDGVPASDDLPDQTMNHRAMPGEGVFDLTRFVRTIEAIGYEGMVSIEVLHAEWRSRSMREFARETFRTSRTFW